MRTRLASFLLAAVAAGSATACPAPETDSSVDIYPTAEQLPANLLRFFVYFPRQMQPDDILDHIALVGADGQEVDGAILSNRYDLWSPDATRLTVLLDPGRVKTGLAAHDALGRALAEGQGYTLLVRDTALDAQGCALGAAREQDFVAGPPDLEAPSPGDWALERPTAGSQDPVTVDLGSPHDHLSLVYRIRVLDAAGDVVPGRIDLGPGESVWHFTPSDPWRDAAYRLAVDERLEDLAGNRPGVLFDQPIGTAEAQWSPVIDWVPGGR
jgi:hypothetical protein